MFSTKSDVMSNMAPLMSVLLKPGQIEELKSQGQGQTIDLNLDHPNQASLAEMIDALGDKMDGK